jgi:hypothetical protein
LRGRRKAASFPAFPFAPTEETAVFVHEAEDDKTFDALACVECRTPIDESRGWRAYLPGDGGITLYCRECAVREFDD